MRAIGSRRGLAVAAAVVVGAVALVASAASLEKVNWAIVGKNALARARQEYPEAVKTEEDAARHVAAAVARKLDELGVRPNYDVSGRLRAAVRYGRERADTGACGHVTAVLRTALKGAGFSENNMSNVSVTRGGVARVMLGGDFVNDSHGALGVVIGGKLRVFDLWAHGRGRGQEAVGGESVVPGALTWADFDRFAKSDWNGMTYGEWAARMTDEGYTKFHDGEGGSVSATDSGSFERVKLGQAGCDRAYLSDCEEVNRKFNECKWPNGIKEKAATALKAALGTAEEAMRRTELAKSQGELAACNRSWNKELVIARSRWTSCKLYQVASAQGVSYTGTIDGTSYPVELTISETSWSGKARGMYAKDGPFSVFFSGTRKGNTLESAAVQGTVQHPKYGVDPVEGSVDGTIQMDGSIKGNFRARGVGSFASYFKRNGTWSAK